MPTVLSVTAQLWQYGHFTIIPFLATVLWKILKWNRYPVYHLICESYPLRTQQIRKLTLMEIYDIQLDWRRKYQTEHIISLKKNNSQWSTCKCTVQVCYMQQSCIVDFRSVWTKNNFRFQLALQWVNDWVWHTYLHTHILFLSSGHGTSVNVLYHLI